MWEENKSREFKVFDYQRDKSLCAEHKLCDWGVSYSGVCLHGKDGCLVHYKWDADYDVHIRNETPDVLTAECFLDDTYFGKQTINSLEIYKMNVPIVEGKTNSVWCAMWLGKRPGLFKWMQIALLLEKMLALTHLATQAVVGPLNQYMLSGSQGHGGVKADGGMKENERWRRDDSRQQFPLRNKINIKKIKSMRIKTNYISGYQDLRLNKLAAIIILMQNKRTVFLSSKFSILQQNIDPYNMFDSQQYTVPNKNHLASPPIYNKSQIAWWDRCSLSIAHSLQNLDHNKTKEYGHFTLKKITTN
ncbi:hypothetical protein RND71_022506 [Anisodus tanguticus]|uniref:Uncharacterized protein n=1 Tax=Anisodus tanguticus TaxID=243964 RepID=A0AAE1RS75_9SOLA|nr:hypothetical protein RND71_022506 [Anisodus tanguticus]